MFVVRDKWLPCPCWFIPHRERDWTWARVSCKAGRSTLVKQVLLPKRRYVMYYTCSFNWFRNCFERDFNLSLHLPNFNRLEKGFALIVSIRVCSFAFHVYPASLRNGSEITICTGERIKEFVYFHFKYARRNACTCKSARKFLTQILTWSDSLLLINFMGMWRG